MKDVNIAITAASYSGNKGAAAMLQSSIQQLYEVYGPRLNINLMSVYPGEDRKQVPYDFIRVVSCKPAKLLFLAFPLAVLYKIIGRIPIAGRLIARNKIIRAYKNTDMVIDEAGISFVDSRGFVMNTYAFVCAAVPMLLGVPVVKYSQALGTFKSPANRFLAKWILPKMKLICARGQSTLDNLKGIGIADNVKLCADGAFTMRDSRRCRDMVDEVTHKDKEFFNNNVVALSISSVVEKKCRKMGINYEEVMVGFIDYLTGMDYHVLLIANAARISSEKSRNNDLLICDRVFGRVKDIPKVRWLHKEMEAEEIREYIGRCRFLVASRFHAMIGALEKRIPVLLVGWSHKYQEVLDMYELGQYAIDFSDLTVDGLKKQFEDFVAKERDIYEKLVFNSSKVMESSRDNIRFISEEINKVIERPEKRKDKLLDINHPDRYMGEHILCRKGYAADDKLRENAASGGMITALLVHLLETGRIDGAWVTKSEIKDGSPGYRSFIATTRDELVSCSSSIYMDMPLLKQIDMVRQFKGRLAVVLTPCLMRGFSAMLEKDSELKKKIVLKLGLFCSGNHSEKATLLALEKSRISLENAERLYYRRGHWRGKSTVIYKDGSEKSFSYTKTICAYKNAYYFEKGSCMLCQDHYGYSADISFGDIWLKEMKKTPVKHTGCIIRNETAFELYKSAVDAGVIIDSHLSSANMIRCQKRALIFKFNASRAKLKYYAKKGQRLSIDTVSKCQWNHRLAFYLAEKNRLYSEEHYDKLKKIPTWMIYYYMCFIRFLLSF